MVNKHKEAYSFIRRLVGVPAGTVSQHHGGALAQVGTERYPLPVSAAVMLMF